jgi:hypothetical protein
MIEQLFERTQFSIPKAEKTALMLNGLSALGEHHRVASPEYARILHATGHGAPKHYSAIEDLPYLPVGLFKSHLIKSIPDDQISATMTSSGTTGQAVSRIILDRETASLQTKALSTVLSHAIGKKRPPMLIVDSKKTIRDPRLISARGAGVLGLMRFGRDHAFLLDDQMTPDPETLRAFLDRHGSEPFLIFGFTFMVWQYLYETVKIGGYDLSKGTLIHSGGWKKLVELSVDNLTFRARLSAACSLENVYNFYGMVEQMGSIFLEGEDGLLYPPNFVDVLIRDPLTLEPLPIGKPGLVQVLSLVPRSYPGHSLLTEDIGMIHSVDSGVGNRMGKALSITGRAPKTELRGCSDTHAFDQPKSSAAA